jgi:hypothetical protein
LTAAVVVAGNDYGNTTTLDRQGPTLLLLEYTFDRRRRRWYDPKPPLTKAEKAKNKEAWKKAEASDKPSAMCARYFRS